MDKKRERKDLKRQTQRSFSDKWTHNPTLALKQTLDEKSEIHKWILSRNGFRNAEDAWRHLRTYSRILDAGCGNGRVTALLATLCPQSRIVGVDIIDLAVARENTQPYPNVEMMSADLTQDLSHLGNFDFIYCQEVLHHTSDAAATFRSLVGILEKKGKIAIYVYRKKAPIREFVDDYLREKISNMDYGEAMETCRRVAGLGKGLSEVDAEVYVDEIPSLGIAKGKYPVQRLVYHFFMKCFWNPELTPEENAAINYDWYHPQNCSRHTMEEVLGWFGRNKLRVTWKHEDPYGITVHGVK